MSNAITKGATTKTTTYRITSRATGLILEELDADTPLDAYRTRMARCGYPTEAAAQSAGYTLAEIPATLAVVEVDPDEPANDTRPTPIPFHFRVYSRASGALLAEVVENDHLSAFAALMSLGLDGPVRVEDLD